MQWSLFPPFCILPFFLKIFNYSLSDNEIMDYTLPIAKRTRSKEALMYRELHESIRKEKKQGAESSRFKVDERVGSIEMVNVVEEEEEEVVVEEISAQEVDVGVHERIRKNKKEKFGFESSRFKNDEPVEGIEKVDMVEEEEDISVQYVDVDSVGGDSDCVGPEQVQNLKARGTEGTDDTMPIILDGSDDDVVVSGDGDDWGVEESDDEDFIFVDGDDEEMENDEERENDDKGLKKGFVQGEGKGKLTKSAKRKRSRALKDDNVQRILVNSILNMGEVPSEDSFCGSEVLEEERSQFASEITLPLKFTFGIEEQSTPPEKSEYEKEIDNLWAEMDFSLKASDITSPDTLMVKNEVASSQKAESQVPFCNQGNHELILDDEIGIVCRLCSFVKVEIRHVVPSFTKCPRERSDWRDPNRGDDSILNELHRHDSGFDFQSGRDPLSHPQGTVWDLVPGVKNSMYAHQREGFEFIWKNIAGGINLEELKNSTSIDGGNGCIISHAPGTGKTRLAMVFLQSYMRLHPRCRPVIVAPRSMLLTWEEEFQKWGIDIPFHNLNKPELSGKENIHAVSLISRVKHGEGRLKLIRMVKLYSWEKDRGILGITYRLFDQLVTVDEKTGKFKEEGNKVSKILLELPGLFVFDEGHTPRNDETGMFKALSKIKTERRIMLSGTPFQNNFEELGNTLGLVLPKFADKKQPGNQRHTQKKRGRKSNAERGIFASLTSCIGKVVDDRFEEKLEELRNMIAPFVHIHKGNVLQESLPGLRHSVVVLQPDDFQKSLFEVVQGASDGSLELNYRMSLISIHPSLLPEQCLEKEDFLVARPKLEGLRLNPEAGIKTKFLLILLQLSDAMNEKVLVFSQYIEPLTLIMEQLKYSLSWLEGKEVLYMDGKRDVKRRQSSINVFNDPTSEARVLLASTRACCEGINLVGASRVVLLDVVWNPSVERQAISRAYRLGQRRVVHVYHLITSETIEGKKYCRKAMKDRWSNLVFSSEGGDNKQTIASENLRDRILDEMVQHDKLIVKIIPQPKESELIKSFGFVDTRP